MAVAAFLTLAVHGALWIALKTEGGVQMRARRLAMAIWWALLAAVMLMTLTSFRIQPHLRESFAARPWGYVFPFLAVMGLIGMRAAPPRREL